MKTLLLLSILGLALVSAELQREDHYTEEADVVAVDDSADEMDNLDDTTRRDSDKTRLKAKFDFGDALKARIKVTQSEADKEKNIATWSARFPKFDSNICPSGELNWHVHQYPVSNTASNMGTMSAQIENFNIQNAPIAYFASDSPGSSTTSPVTLAGPYSPKTVLGNAATSIDSTTGKLRLDWTLTGLDQDSSGGIHIHYGTTCDTEATIKGDAPAGANKGHYYVPDATPDPSEDPWGPVKWKSDVDGIAKGFYEIPKTEFGLTGYNRVVVVHNSAGGKIGCGVLASYTPTTVTGVATASTTSDGALKLEWSLTGLDKDSSGGIHIHYGTTCDNEATVKGIGDNEAPAGANKGHYYVPDATPDPSEDPWGHVKWKSDGDGHANGSEVICANIRGPLGCLQLFPTLSSAYNRVVVVHNAASEKVGCGVLAINSAPGCGSDVTGGHYDPTFACGPASQNNANGICPILRATNQAPAGSGPVKGEEYACQNTTQWACEIGDQSGKMGKLDPNVYGTQRLKDMWMEPIDNLKGRSMVLHCCSAAGNCGARLACANLEEDLE